MDSGIAIKTEYSNTECIFLDEDDKTDSKDNIEYSDGEEDAQSSAMEEEEPTPERKKGQKITSRAWLFFEAIGSTKAKCKCCNKQLAFSTTYNLMRHTKAKHPELLTAEDVGIKHVGKKPGAENEDIEVDIGQETMFVNHYLKKPMKPPRGLRRTSIIWNYFTETEESTITCNICNKKLSFALKHTANLIRHMRILHPHLIKGGIAPSNKHGGGAYRGRTSEAWQFFKKKPDKTVECNICNKQLSFSTKHTANLLRHIRVLHPHALSAESTARPGDPDYVEECKNGEKDETDESECESLPSSLECKTQTNPIWLHFKRMAETSAKCKHCSRTLIFTRYSKSNLKRHMRTQHPLLFGTPEHIASNVTSTADTRSISSQDQSNNVVDVEHKARSFTPTRLVWKYFERIGNGRARCRQCAKKLKYTETRIYNLYRHIKQLHQPTTKAVVKKVEPATKIYYDNNTKLLREYLIKLITQHYLPPSIVSATDFETFIQDLSPKFDLPTESRIVLGLLPMYYNVAREKLRKMLSEAKYIALSIDTWTSPDYDNFVSLSAHFANANVVESYIIESYTYLDSYNSTEFRDQVCSICDNWSITAKIVSITYDRINTPTTLIDGINLLKWEALPCFIQSLNAVVQSALLEVEGLVSKVIKIVTLFKSNEIAAQLLAATQEELAEPVVQVKYEGASHWRLVYDMFQRVLEIRISLTKTLSEHLPTEDQLTVGDIAHITAACSILKPVYAIFAKISCKNNHPFSEVIILTDLLKTKCDTLITTTELSIDVYNMGMALLNGLNSEFTELFNTTFAESTILDPRFKQHGLANNNNLFDATCATLVSLSPVEYEDTAEHTELMVQKASLNELNAYLEEPTIPRDENPIEWWQSNSDSYPGLFELAQRKMCIPSSALSPARVFTVEGRQLTQRRNQLRGKRAHHILFLHQFWNMQNTHVVTC